MRIDILSLFPAIAAAPLAESMIGKAQQRGLVSIHAHNLRDWARDKHRTTDDAPYGGSQGMVMKCEPFFEAVEALRDRRPETGTHLAEANDQTRSANGEEAGASNRKDPAQPREEAGSGAAEPKLEEAAPSRVVLMSPAGRRFDQRIAAEYAVPGSRLILLCGHYEGIDQRVIDHLVDDEISIGDYVLTNGALAAAVFTDAVVRLLPGVLGDSQSAPDDSFSSGLLEFPQYTRPVEYRGWRVPDVLLSGNHGAVAAWRREKALEKTRRVRPDLLSENQRL
jgi:tRNA (guanine37-N1)-methyltransferase